MESIKKSLFTQPPIEKGAPGPAAVEETKTPQLSDSAQITGNQSLQEIRPAAVTTASGVTDTVDGRALALLKEEPHFWAGALPELLTKEDTLNASGRNYALVAMAAQEPTLAGDATACAG